MALFTDGNPSTIEELRTYESSLLDVSRVEQIDLDAKLALATAEVGDQIETFLLRHSSQDPQSGERRRIGVSTVVTTEPVKRWHAFETLSMVFSDAFGSQLNERYEAKRDQYLLAAERAKRRTFEFGIGVVGVPIPRASAAICFSVSGTGSAGTFFVSVSWVGEREGAASAPTTFETTADTDLSVIPGAAPSGVTGWNVYVGVTRATMARQNTAVLNIGEAWVLTAGLLPGAAPSTGQSADFWVMENRTSQRG